MKGINYFEINYNNLNAEFYSAFNNAGISGDLDTALRHGAHASTMSRTAQIRHRARASFGEANVGHTRLIF